MEYLILNEYNEWMSTCRTKTEAIKELADMKKCGFDNNGEEMLNGYYYIYEAKEVKQIKIDK